MEHHLPYIFDLDIHEIIYKFRAFFTKQYFELKNENLRTYFAKRVSESEDRRNELHTTYHITSPTNSAPNDNSGLIF